MGYYLKICAIFHNYHYKWGHLVQFAQKSKEIFSFPQIFKKPTKRIYSINYAEASFILTVSTWIDAVWPLWYFSLFSFPLFLSSSSTFPPIQTPNQKKRLIVWFGALQPLLKKLSKELHCIHGWSLIEVEKILSLSLKTSHFEGFEKNLDEICCAGRNTLLWRVMGLSQFTSMSMISLPSMAMLIGLVLELFTLVFKVLHFYLNLIDVMCSGCL